jgi:hypothetical protein
MLPLAAICPIAMMTFTSPDLDAVQERYQDHLHYELRSEGHISPELAASWGAPKVAGRRYILLGPASGEKIYLRAIEGPRTLDFEPLKSYGWTTAEIVVKDAFTLSHALKGTPFVEETANRVLPLDFTNDMINFRVVGPDGDALFLTQLDDEVPNFPFAKPNSFVDHIFMTLVTNRDPGLAQVFYENLFHLPGVSPLGTGDHKLHLINLPKGCVLELDSPGPETTERPQLDGELPPGMAISTYYMETLDRQDLNYLTEPRVYDEAPYVKRRGVTLKGPSGELIELLEFKMRP